MNVPVTAIGALFAQMPASLRSDGVRDHPGMPFGFIPDLAFGFAIARDFYPERLRL